VITFAAPCVHVDGSKHCWLQIYETQTFASFCFTSISCFEWWILPDRCGLSPLVTYMSQKECPVRIAPYTAPAKSHFAGCRLHQSFDVVSNKAPYVDVESFAFW